RAAPRAQRAQHPRRAGARAAVGRERRRLGGQIAARLRPQPAGVRGRRRSPDPGVVEPRAQRDRGRRRQHHPAHARRTWAAHRRRAAPGRAAAGGGGRRPRGPRGAGRADLPAAGLGPRRGQRAGPGAGPAGRARAPRLAGVALAPGAHRVHPAAPHGRTRGSRMSARIWVVDDDRSVRFVLAAALREAGHLVTEFEGAAPALAALAQPTADLPVPDLLFTDVRMPGDDGLVLLDKLRTRAPGLPVVVMSAYTDVASTAGAFRGGAREFLSKPFDLDEAVALAERTLAARADVDDDDDHPADAVGTPVLGGDSPRRRALYGAIGRLEQAPLSVLITGETGTGKELVARALHRESPRAARSFVALNTAAIPAELLESELFGHEAGAFTGATRRHIGRFEQADGGTLFLDEIGDMPLPLQTRLLRVLAEGEFFRVGGRELVRVDVRVIA